MENMEVWKDIPGYEGLYQASNMGRVRSLDKVVNHNYGGKAIKKGKIMKPHKAFPYQGSKPRLQLGLIKDGIRHYPALSRLVYSAFYGEIPDDMQVNHIDEDTENNRIENLNLMSPKENTNWGTGIERRSKTISIRKKGTQLLGDNPKAREVFMLDQNGIVAKKYGSLKEAAIDNNCTWGAIYKRNRYGVKKRDMSKRTFFFAYLYSS